MIRRLLLTLSISTLLSGSLPSPAAGQRLLHGAAGGLIGMGAGGYVALGVVTFKARHGKYLYVVGDAAFGWESAAVLAGGGTGLALGLWDLNRLRNGVLGSIAGGLVGTGVGALVGHRVWPPPEGKWAGGVIGGSAGILLGVGIGALLFPGSKSDAPTRGGAPAAPQEIGFSIPVGR